MGQDPWPCTSHRTEAGRCWLSVDQWLLPGTKAGNCKGKSDTRKWGSFFPSCGHKPKQQGPPAIGGGRWQAGRTPGASGGCGGPEGGCSGPLCKGLWQRWRGSRGGTIGARPRPVDLKEHVGQHPFPLEEGRFRGHMAQKDLGLRPRDSTCLCKSLLLPDPHLTQPVKWGQSCHPK